MDIYVCLQTHTRVHTLIAFVLSRKIPITWVYHNLSSRWRCFTVFVGYRGGRFDSVSRVEASQSSTPTTVSWSCSAGIKCQINRWFPLTLSDSFEIWHNYSNFLETNTCQICVNRLDPIRPLLRCRPLPRLPGSGFWIALVVNRIQKWRHLLENSALFPSGKLTQFAVNYGIYWHSFLFENFLCSEF